jgi:hypothetical protein
VTALACRGVSSRLSELGVPIVPSTYYVTGSTVNRASGNDATRTSSARQRGSRPPTTASTVLAKCGWRRTVRHPGAKCTVER